MPFTPQSIEEKPYNACLNCVHIGKNCDGPNFLTMDAERFCEWCKLRKEYLGWTNAYVADLAQISKISVDRVMSGNVKDVRTSTMQAITKALVSGEDGSWGQYPCAMPSLGELKTVFVDNPDLVARAEKAESEKNIMQKSLDAMAAEYRINLELSKKESQKQEDFLKEQIKFKEEQMTVKDRLLKERYDFLVKKDKLIKLLSVMLAVSVLIIFAAMIADMSNPDVGFFWLNN